MYSKAYVEIGNICNMNCSFCIGTSRARRQMTFDEFSYILSQLSGVTKYIYYHIMGEPLLHPELFRFISHAKERGFFSIVTTNGTSLDRLGQQLIDSGVYKVNISLHSFEGEDEQKQEKYVRSCLNFADTASKTGVLTVLRLWNDGCDGGKNDYTLALAKEVFSAAEWKKEQRGTRIQDKLYLEFGERFDWPDLSADCLGESVFCYGLRDQFGILCDGTVVPCCLDHNGDIPLGNIFSTPLSEILSSQRAKDIKDGFSSRVAKEELCRRCGYARRFK